MSEESDACIRQSCVDGVLTLAFNAANAHNPFSAQMERELTDALRAAGEDGDVDLVVLTGGEDRSFSVGGDFNEVSRFEGGPEVDRWIEDIIAMYVACLELDKPTIALLDRYVIGIGFQLALCCDYRLASERAQLVMPELQRGVSCVLGQYMLEVMVGRAVMQRLVIGCEPVDAAEATRLGLVNATCAVQRLHHEFASELIARLRSYPRVSYRVTKQEMNLGFAAGLRGLIPAAQAAHRESFMARSAHPFMTKILGEDP